jgi:hypothetical protein
MDDREVQLAGMQAAGLFERQQVAHANTVGRRAGPQVAQKLPETPEREMRDAADVKGHIVRSGPACLRDSAIEILEHTARLAGKHTAGFSRRDRSTGAHEEQLRRFF